MNVGDWDGAMVARYYLYGQTVTGNYNSPVLVLEHSPILQIAKIGKYLLKKNDLINSSNLHCDAM